MSLIKMVAISNIAKCKELGLQIAIDDFGTGNTSMDDLKNYSVDIVKLDRSLLLAADFLSYLPCKAFCPKPYIYFYKERNDLKWTEIH